MNLTRAQRRWCLTILCAGGMIGMPELLAQARRAGGPVAPANTAGAKDTGVSVRKLEGVGNNAHVRTPAYSTDASESKANAREWARIVAQYETEAEWTDELEFRYYVLVKHPRTNAQILFPATVSYIDIPKGQHLSTMFLRPHTVERYGEVQAAGVEVFLNGELVASAAQPENSPQWWRQASGVKTMEGVLLNRNQTPFALVNVDAYETIKAK